MSAAGTYFNPVHIIIFFISEISSNVTSFTFMSPVYLHNITTHTEYGILFYQPKTSLRY
jgi:hypothetical protein